MPEKQGWRKKQTRQPGGARRAGRGEDDAVWRTRRARESQDSLMSHRLRLFGLAAAVLLLLGWLVYAMVWRSYDSPIVAVVNTRFDTSPAIPPNAFALEDLVRLQTVSDDNADLRLADSVTADVTRDVMLNLLRDSLGKPPGGPGRDVFVVYVSTHGVIDKTGEPCLLLSDSDPLDPSTWLSVRDVLTVVDAQLKDGGAKVVMLLDCDRLDFPWSFGQLCNGFAEGLQRVHDDLFGERENQRVFLLNSARPGQQARVAPELGGSVFGFFAAVGLDGAADDGSGKVTLLGLRDYLKREVSQWVSFYRDGIQEPTLIPDVSSSQDFAIAFAGGGNWRETLDRAAEGMARQREIVGERWNRVKGHWKRFGRLDRERIARQNPLALARLEHKLLRAERLTLAGEAYGDQLTATLGEADRLFSAVERPARPDRLEMFSLPLADSLRPLGDEELGTAREYFQIWIAPADAEGNKKPVPEQPIDYLPAAKVAWTWLVERGDDVGRKDLDTVLDFVDRYPRGGDPDCVEIHFLRMLRAYLDWDSEGLADPSPALSRAIRARARAEQLAAPDDVRIQYWLQERVAAGDESRRGAEDLLFVGDQRSVDRGTGALAALESDQSEYGQAAALAEETRQWHRQRDLAWSEVPYLTDWLLRRHADREGATRRDSRRADYDEIVSDPPLFVERLIADLHRLDVSLGRSLTDGGEAMPTETRAAHDDFRRRFDALKTYFAEHCRTLSEANRNKVLLRDTLDAMLTPLIDPRLRVELGDRALDVMFTTANPAKTGEENVVTTPSDTDGRPTRLQQLAQRQYHPALQLLRREGFDLLDRESISSSGFRERAADEDPLAWLARQGEEVRWLLSGTADAAEKLEAETDSRLRSFGSGTSTESPFHARYGLFEADRLTRAACVAHAPHPWKWGGDPVARLDSVDWSFLCGWHGYRTLRDFWGPRPGESTSYFDAVAGRYVAAAKRFDNVAKRIQFQGVTLDEERGRQADAIAASRIETKDIASTAVSEVSGAESQTVDVFWRDGVPIGTASVFIHSRAGSDALASLIPVRVAQEAIRRHGREIQIGQWKPPINHEIPVESIADVQSTNLFATALYRGHLRSSSFGFQVAKPEVTIAQLAPRPDSRVLVDGDKQKAGHVLFVLDCSGSMTTANRMEGAKEALLSILGLLQREGGYRVGLMAYGHRFRYVDTAQGRRVEEHANQGRTVDRSFRNHPDIDVDEVVRIGDMRLSGPQIQRALNLPAADPLGLEPWGQTPLYEAILQALDNMTRQNVPEEQPQHIVVLTDGEDKLVDDSMKMFDANRSKKDVLESRLGDARAVKLHVIGINLPQNAGVRELKAIVDGVGDAGSYQDGNPEQLVEFMRNSLRLVRYSVERKGGFANPTRVDLGTIVDVGQVNNDGQAHRVELHETRNVRVAPVDVTLYGGEFLKMIYDRDEYQLEFERYLPRTKLATETRDYPGRDQSFEFTVEAGRTGRDLHFDISIQDTKPTRFTDRPRYVWVEIEPLPSAGRVYEFSDLEFVPETPVPVMRFTARNWPRVESADIRLWVSYNDNARRSTIQLDPNGGETGIKDGRGELLFATRRRTEGDHMIVDVSEDRSLTGAFSPVHVRLHSPRPREVHHLHSRFADGREIIRHRFYYEKGAALPTVDIVPKSEIQSDSVYVEFRDVRTPLN